MPCRVPKRRFSCGAPQHLTKNQNLSLTKTIRASLRTAFPSGTRLVFQKYLSRQHRAFCIPRLQIEFLQHEPLQPEESSSPPIYRKMFPCWKIGLPSHKK